MNNIVGVCPECTEKRQREFQEKLSSNLEFFKNVLKEGKTLHFKFKFDQLNSNEPPEHMWVLVTQIDDQNMIFTGTLDNDPVFATQYSYGQILTLDLFQVSESYPKPNLN